MLELFIMVQCLEVFVSPDTLLVILPSLVKQSQDLQNAARRSDWLLLSLTYFDAWAGFAIITSNILFVWVFMIWIIIARWIISSSEHEWWNVQFNGRPGKLLWYSFANCLCQPSLQSWSIFLQHLSFESYAMHLRVELYQVVRKK